MNIERVVNSRPDRDITKKILVSGDCNLVPYEESRCKIVLRNVTCTNEKGNCEIEAESRVFSRSFDGNVLVGDNDCFIDRDFELILQQMCSGETCEATLLYKDSERKLVKKICCTVELKDITDEQLISDWSWIRLLEAAEHHKECGITLIKQKRVVDAFRRFSKALKMLIALEPIDKQVIDQEKLKEIIDMRVKLYSNLAHCQLQFHQYEAALELCNQALKYDPKNMKAIYRRATAYSGMKLYEEAWKDVQHMLDIDPSDKAALQKANSLRPEIEKMNKAYANVMKKMFS